VAKGQIRHGGQQQISLSFNNNRHQIFIFVGPCYLLYDVYLRHDIDNEKYLWLRNVFMYCNI